MGGSTATRVRSFKLHDDQAETVNAAIEKMKKLSNTPDDSAALAAICLDKRGRSRRRSRACQSALEAGAGVAAVSGVGVEK